MSGGPDMGGFEGASAAAAIAPTSNAGMLP